MYISVADTKDIDMHIQKYLWINRRIGCKHYT